MIATRSFAQTLLPDTAAARAALVVGGSLLIALAAQVAVPFTPVPLTGQTFGVLLVAAALGARLGAASVALYVFEGLAGLPVFAPGGTLGIARLLGPTGGYLVGFVVGAFVTGALADRGWDRTLRRAVVAMAAGDVVIFAFGLAGLARFVPLEGIVAAGLAPFVPGEIVKIALAASLLPVAWRVAR